MNKKIDIIVPCYNEEEVLHETSGRLLKLMEEMISNNMINQESFIVFVDDGSADSTWKIIEELSEKEYHFKGIKLSRNKGHQNALLAGLHTTQADAAISIDADLQDDINAIKEMVVQYNEGFDVVYGVRNKREKDSFLKRFTAQNYYKVLKLMGVNIVYDHADYRLLSRPVLDSLKDYKEVNVFLRGIIPMIGYSSTKVYYERDKRFAGESKYSVKKMISFAWDGISSLSIAPLRIITSLGFIIFLASFAITIWILFIRFFTDNAMPGWASTTLPIYFLGGIQLLSIGIVGEYVGKIYMETKRRPRYVIEKIIKK